MPVDGSRRTACLLDHRGVARGVSWASVSHRVVLAWHDGAGYCVADVDTAALSITGGVHGAIGTTREHRLHEFTKPALAWRSEFGSVQHWDDTLTDFATVAGAGGLWPLITGT